MRELPGFGSSEEWADFHRRHPLFAERFPRLVRALEMAFIREFRTDDPLDRNIFFLGNVCREDFMEILLLCGNGYGIGGQKLVRGMFERAIAARYMAMHPEKAKDFISFGWVNQHKLLMAIRETFGDDVLTEEQVAETKLGYEDFKKQGRSNWTDLDFVAMAREVSKVSKVGKLIIPAYYQPLFETHATVQCIISRIEQSNGGTAFDGGPQRRRADDALMTAHNILLDVLALEGNHFHLDALNEVFDDCVRDWLDIWGDQNSAPS